MARRLGQDESDLARYNGFAQGQRLRNGEVLALPKISTNMEQDFAEGEEIEETTLSKDLNILELADTAIKIVGGSDNKRTNPTSSDTKNLVDPVKHKVVRGETAFIISRLYNISVRSLADWNGLDSNYTIREGQYLLIPLPRAVSYTHLTLPTTPYV